MLLPNVSEDLTGKATFFGHPFLKTAKAVSLTLLPPNQSWAPAGGAHGKRLLAEPLWEKLSAEALRSSPAFFLIISLW